MWLWMSAALAVQTVTLDEAMQRSADRPAAAAAAADAGVARRDATTAWLAALGPALGGSATAWRRSEELAIETPIGPFVQQPDRQTDAGARLAVPLLAPAELAAATAASRGARAADHQADRRRQELALEAADAFLDAVVLCARADAVDAYVAVLEERLDQANAVHDAGLSLASDALRVEVALADARQQQLALTHAGEVARWRLGWTVGEQEPVAAAFVFDPVDAPAIDVERALLARSDLAALDDQASALQRQRTATALEAAPRLDGYGAVSWTDREGLVANQWAEAGLELTWTLGARGTRISRSAALAARIDAVRHTRDDAELAVRVQLQQAAADQSVARAEVGVREAAVALAAEAARLLSESYAAGESTLTDSLQADAELRDQQARLAISRAEATRAQVHLDIAAGRW